MKSKSSGRNHPHDSSPLPDRKSDLLIATVGASAGGIEAFTALISNLATDSGMAFVLVQHLDPEHHSMLTELLSKKTAMHVKEVTNGMSVEPNHVCVLPPNATMSISHHTLQVAPRGKVAAFTFPSTISCRLSPTSKAIMPLASSYPARAPTEPPASPRFKPMVA